MTSYKDSVSGLKIEGSWNDIVEHGEKVAEELKNSDIKTDDFDSSIEEFESWRPKRDEDLSNDIKRKTAEEASIGESNTEENIESVKNGVKRAGSNIKQGTPNMKKKKKFDTEKMTKSLSLLVGVLDYLARSSFRQSEEVVYKRFMTLISPHYFDNKLISANLTKSSEDSYVLEININDDSLKDNIKNKIREHYRKNDDVTVENEESPLL